MDAIRAQIQDIEARIEAWEPHLRSIAESSEQMASNIERLAAALLKAQEDNSEMIAALQGKKQVPLPVFFLVVGMLVLFIVVQALSTARMDLELSATGMKLKRLQETVEEAITPHATHK